MGAQMKGLTQFIGDIRNARAQEEEDRRIQAELVNIQRQFADHQHLTGYQRKKYICKLLFIHLLGNQKFDFGFIESVELLSSSAYSEKQIGYLAMEFFVGSDKELLLTVVNSLKNDLASPNSDLVSLALECIATLGEETMAHTLAEDVFNLLRSPTVEPMLKKKASLSLLKLVQSAPEIILEEHPNWIQRITACLDDEDIGFAQSVSSLILFIAKISPESCKQCLSTAIRRLSDLVVENKCPPDYYYYGVPAPWFTIKLLHLIETLLLDSSFENVDPVALATLRQILSSAVDRTVNSNVNHRTQQAKNVQSSILFASISLGAHLDPTNDATVEAINALGSLLVSPETNTRYLALDALIKVTSRAESSVVQSAYDHLSKILTALRDRDISVRRKALDLLYTICDSGSVENICTELLSHLTNADFSLRNEIAIKVAALAEKFATDASWYIVTSFNLISVAGNQLADEIWERTVQIIVNNEKIQPLAVKNIARKLKMPNFPESIIKVAAFTIGEFGYTVESSLPAEEQYDLLISKYYYCSFLTRSMLLSCFLKMFVRHEQLRAPILDVFESETVSIDSEIQQRATEYLKMVTRDDDLAVAKMVVQQMPPFVNNASPLISRLGNVRARSETVSSNSSLTRKTTTKAPMPPPPRRTKTITSTPTGSSFRSFSPQKSDVSRRSSFHPQLSSDNLTTHSNDLMSLNNNNNSTVDFTEAESADDVAKRTGPALSPNWEEGFYRMLHFDQGIFYESSLLKIVFRCRKEKSEFSFQLTYVNQSPVPISAFTVQLKPASVVDPPYILSNSQLPETQIPVNGRAVHTFKCTVRSMFDNSKVPFLDISYMSGTFTQLSLKLPILPIKCLTPAPISNPADFFKRWQQIGALGAEGESQRIFTVAHRHNNASLHRLVTRLGLSVVENVDPNGNNIVGASILHTATGSCGCLLRLEPDDDGRQFRATMRCTATGVARTLSDTLVDLFQHGF